MKRSINLGRYGRLFAGIAGLVLLVAWAGGCFARKLPPGEVDGVKGESLPPNALIYTVKSENIAPLIDVVGTVESAERINLSARIPSYVKEMFVSAGDRVAKGQVLVRLDDRELKEQLAMANAKLLQAETEYNRTRKLVDANAATDQALTEVKANYEGARAQVEQIKVMLTYTEIRSPIDGVVTDRQIEAGDLANPGQTLLAVYDPDHMRLEVPVPVRLAEKLKLGEQVEVDLDRPEHRFMGEVAEVVGEINPMSRTQRVKVDLLDAPSSILPGTFGRVWVNEDARATIVVPASAIQRVGQLEQVDVVEDNRIRKRLVRTGPRHGDSVGVLSGLRDGDAVLLHNVE